jgi:catechol 2,3-dioxygenase-like lactoylglutathione lyase family enzyme
MTTLSHLHLHVRDRARAEAFYRRWFGLTVSRRGDALTFLRDDATFDLALMDDPAPTAMPPWFHLGFRRDSADAVAAQCDAMRAASVPIVKALYRDDTFASFRCADPDGYAIEIYWEQT